MHSIAAVALLALQSFVVLFVAFHNWIPLGTLNNVKGSAANPMPARDYHTMVGHAFHNESATTKAFAN